MHDDIVILIGGVAGEITDDFLENIFQRDQTLYLAVLVDNNSEAAAGFLKIEQLCGQAGAFRNKVGLLRKAFNGIVR